MNSTNKKEDLARTLMVDFSLQQCTKCLHETVTYQEITTATTLADQINEMRTKISQDPKSLSTELTRIINNHGNPTSRHAT